MTRSAHFLTLPGPAQGLRIGLLGGSFNPAHAGHLHVADTAMKRLQLDWVWWIVARGNPLKAEQGDFATRLASARRVARHPRMLVTDFEARAGLTYTADTLDALMARAPGAKFVWLIGADNLAGFHRWARWQSIARAVPVAVIARPGYGLKARSGPFARRFAAHRLPQSQAARLADAAPPAWVYLQAPLNPISSTLLRTRAKT